MNTHKDAKSVLMNWMEESEGLSRLRRDFCAALRIEPIILDRGFSSLLLRDLFSFSGYQRFSFYLADGQGDLPTVLLAAISWAFVRWWVDRRNAGCAVLTGRFV